MGQIMTSLVYLLPMFYFVYVSAGWHNVLKYLYIYIFTDIITFYIATLEQIDIVYITTQQRNDYVFRNVTDWLTDFNIHFYSIVAVEYVSILPFTVMVCENGYM